MATRFSNDNLAAHNIKQLRIIAREVGVAPATLINTLTSKATLITAIKAK